MKTGTVIDATTNFSAAGGELLRPGTGALRGAGAQTICSDAARSSATVSGLCPNAPAGAEGSNIVHPEAPASADGGTLAREAGAGPGAAPLHADLAVAGIARRMRQIMAAPGGRQWGRAALKRHPYWPTFCAMVRAGQVPEDFAGAWSAWAINWARK